MSFMTLLIKNGLVFSGSDVEPEKKDIFIRGDKIVKLGNFSRNSSDEVLDARGLKILPGFVDVGTDFDHYFGPFSIEIQRSFIRRGVTTLIGGNFGVSLAPFPQDFFDFLCRSHDFSLGSLNWHKIGDFLKAVRRQKMIVNFGTMIGYANLKTIFTKGVSRDLTDRERFALIRFLGKAFRDGAFGLSFDFSNPIMKNVAYHELFDVAKETAKWHRLFVVRLNENELTREEARMILKLAEATGVSVHVAGLAFLNDDVMLECFEANGLLGIGATKANVSFDFVLNGMRTIPVSNFLPSRVMGEGFKKAFHEVQDGHFNREIESLFEFLDQKDIIISFVPHNLKVLRGKTLKEFAEARMIPKKLALLELLRITRFQAVISFKGTKKFVCDFLRASNSFLSSGGLIFPNSGDCDYGVKILSEAVKDCNFELRKIVSKLSLLPARRFEIEGRGAIREGFYGDLVLMSADKIEKVIINGKLVFDNGKFFNEATGKVLTR